MTSARLLQHSMHSGGALLTGVEPRPIWQWGFIKRVSTGLLLQMRGLNASDSSDAGGAEWGIGPCGGAVEPSV